MELNNLFKIQEGYYASVIPGSELCECVEVVVVYCRENNTSAKLEFNGVVNRIESWINPIELYKVWYNNPSDKWYDEQKIKYRAKQIDKITD
jgi:hypothetical protein